VAPDWRTLAIAALANLDIQSYMADPKLGLIWTEESIRRTPTCRNEWEHVTVIATAGEAKASAKHKSWGGFLGTLPLTQEDPVHWCRILYLYKARSPYNRRVEQRHTLKRILGRQHRPLVTQAARSTKRDFLASLSEPGVTIIKRRLNLEPGQFWRAAKGHAFLDLPKPPVQFLLFPD
jgi:hypothetical protein